MLAALQGTIQDNAIISDELRPFSGRVVTIIINEPESPFLDIIQNDALVIPTELDADSYVKELRDNDRI